MIDLRLQNCNHASPWFFLKKYFFIRNLGMVSNSFVWIMSFRLAVEFWNWHRILFVYFLFFDWSKIRTNWSASLSMKSLNLFYTFKVFDTNFNIQMTWTAHWFLVKWMFLPDSCRLKCQIVSRQPWNRQKIDPVVCNNNDGVCLNPVRHGKRDPKLVCQMASTFFRAIVTCLKNRI